MRSKALVWIALVIAQSAYSEEGWRRVVLDTERFGPGFVHLTEDGRYLFNPTETYPRQIEVWDIETQSRISSLPTEFHFDPGLMISQGDMLVSFIGQNALIWNYRSGEKVSQFEVKLGRDNYSGLRQPNWAQLNPDGNLLLVQAYGAVGVWDVKSGRELKVLGRDGRDYYKALGFLADGASFGVSQFKHPGSVVSVFDAKSVGKWKERKVLEADVAQGRIIPGSDRVILRENYQWRSYTFDLRTKSTTENFEYCSFDYPSTFVGAALLSLCSEGYHQGWKIRVTDLASGKFTGETHSASDDVFRIALRTDGRIVAVDEYGIKISE
jgi:WD40 repeat protein